MNDSSEQTTRATESTPHGDRRSAAAVIKQNRRESIRWWIKLVAQPLLFLLVGALVIVGLGIAQKMEWISAGGGGGQQSQSVGEAGSRYICPMMCTPPQSEPGRCPVCAMELVPATAGFGNTDSQSVQIDASARRVANILTASVESLPMTQTIRAIGKISYDEGTQKTISAYVDGRIEQQYADFTGAFVKHGDPLALIYSPRLYSSQVEFLLARKAYRNSRSSTLKRVSASNRDIYESSRERLVELGLSERQIQRLEETGEADSRMHVTAPISGTVIEKLAAEGDYVKEGQPIYRLADLSTVWLMLELFPEDAASVRFGQKVEAEMQSTRDQKFEGRVTFIDPHVDANKRTVGVRVVIANPTGKLRVGDYAKATVNVPISLDDEQRLVFDPELATKWIGPRHPHIVAAVPGNCPICDAALVPASDLGFTGEPISAAEALVVPRNAVLMAGANSVVYVETEPGRFEIRQVVLGPSCGDQIVIRSGVKKGENVAVKGNFLIDSQMQLAGNPSLIDPTKGESRLDDEMSEEILAAISELSAEDQALVMQQKLCPVTDYPLGSMGVPPKVDVDGQPVFLCCEGCRKSLLDEPEKYLAKLAADPPQPDAEAEPTNLPPIGMPQLIEPQLEVAR